MLQVRKNKELNSKKNNDQQVNTMCNCILILQFWKMQCYFSFTGKLVWRTLSGKQFKIIFHMHVPYHGKCLMDVSFAYITILEKGRRFTCWINDNVASVVRKIATSNEVGAGGKWFDWRTFTANYFIPFKGTRQYRHVVFRSDKPRLCFS